MKTVLRSDVYTYCIVFTNIFELNLISIHSVVCNEEVRENNCSVMYAFVIFRIVSDHDIRWLVEKENRTKRRFIISEAFYCLIRYMYIMYYFLVIMS